MDFYIAHAETEAGDSYYYLFDYKPNREEVQALVWEEEGKSEDLEYYLELTRVNTFNINLRTRSDMFLQKPSKPKDEKVFVRYEVRYGAFGAYFYDQVKRKDLTLIQVVDLLNKGSLK